MKALSIRQPWLFMILKKYKDIEIRTWNTHYRGILYLHASKKFDNDGYEYLKSLGFQMPLKDHFELGKLLGTAHLHHVLKFKDTNDFYSYKDRHLNNPSWWSGRQKGFMFKDIKTIEPIEYKGGLMLFNVSI